MTSEDVDKMFTRNMDGLYLLALLLTGDREKAEQCFVASLEQFVTANNDLRRRARSWVKCIIVENAIRDSNPRPGHAHSSSPANVFPYIGQRSGDPSRHFEVDAILALDNFERFVFVMSVLEHYSKHECALLLQCSVSEIREARTCALKELINSLHIVFPHNRCLTRRRNRD